MRWIELYILYLSLSNCQGTFPCRRHHVIWHIVRDCLNKCEATNLVDTTWINIAAVWPKKFSSDSNHHNMWCQPQRLRRSRGLKIVYDSDWSWFVSNEIRESVNLIKNKVARKTSFHTSKREKFLHSWIIWSPTVVPCEGKPIWLAMARKTLFRVCDTAVFQHQMSFCKCAEVTARSVPNVLVNGMHATDIN